MASPRPVVSCLAGIPTVHEKSPPMPAAHRSEPLSILARDHGGYTGGHPDLRRSAHLERIDVLEHGARGSASQVRISKFIEARKTIQDWCWAKSTLPAVHVSTVVYQAVVAVRAPGRFLSRKANIIHVQPLKSMSIPTNNPMIKKPEAGHCTQIMMPRARLRTPPKKIQPNIDRHYRCNV